MSDDALLVRRALGGDRSACDDLVRRHTGSVRATVLSRLGPRSEVEDVVQETFLRGLTGLAELRDPERIGPWLRGIAHNRCREIWRRRRTEPLRVDPAAEPDAEPSVELGEEATPLARAVWALPEKLREAILLFYVEQQSYESIATCLGITTAAVNRRLTRARNLLRERMAGEDALA